mmetsp:Transcript_42173/g.85278  ORF Transcript_42173/g.85278 Transcript_42173/m.85278 type:complete len:417 (+) Transcript_42173:127-1377(+)
MKQFQVLSFLLVLLLVSSASVKASTDDPKQQNAFASMSKNISSLLEEHDCSVIAALDYTNRLSNKQVSVISFTNRTNHINAGLGAQLTHLWVPTLINAFFVGARIVLDKNSNHSWNYGCPNYPHVADVLEKARLKEPEDTIVTRGVRVPGIYKQVQITCRGAPLAQIEGSLTNAAFDFWVRFKPGIATMIKQLKDSVLPSSHLDPYFAVHIRVGDKQALEQHNPGHDNPEAWANNIEKLFYQDKKSLSIRLIVVSDACYIVHSTMDLLRKRGITNVATTWGFPCKPETTLYQQKGMSKAVNVTGHNQGVFNKERTCADVTDFFTTIDLLRKARAVLLSVGSNVGRMVSSLRAADNLSTTTVRSFTRDRLDRSPPFDFSAFNNEKPNPQAQAALPLPASIPSMKDQVSFISKQLSLM